MNNIKFACSLYPASARSLNGRRRLSLMTRFILPLLLLVTSFAQAAAPQQSLPRLREIAAHKDDWFTTDEGKRILDNIISWQNQNGGWWKFYDPSIPRPAELPPPSTTNGPPGDTEEDWRRTSTFDN